MINIERGKQKHIAECIAICKSIPDVFNGFYDEMQESLTKYDFWIAKSSLSHDENEIVGFICVKKISNEMYDLDFIATKPKMQRVGVGTLLIKYACMELQRMVNALLLRVEVIAESNDPDPIYKATNEFYKKCGFILVDTIPEYYKWWDKWTCNLYVKIV